MSPTNPPTNETQNASISRRHLLGSALAGGIALLGVPKPVRGGDEDIPVTGVDGSEAEAYLDRAWTDADVQQLHAELAIDGFEPHLDEAIVQFTETADRSYHTVAIPFHDHANSKLEAVILWSDTDIVPIQRRTFTPVGDGEFEMESVIITPDGRLEGTTTVTPDIWWWFCSDLNWSCVMSVAGAWAGAIATCAGCVIDPSKLTCLACIGAVLSATGGTLACEFCND